MRLISPSPGESMDRMTILLLKIDHSDRQEFKDELRMLQQYISDRKFHISGELTDELKKINTRLWDLEDKQRSILRDHWDIDHIENQMYFDTFAGNAILVVQLNDARAETVRKINVACGIDSMEKLHATH